MNVATTDARSPHADAILTGQLRDGMSFNEKVWAMTARIPAGKVTTYGEIARALGTRAYRAVGSALNRNPYAPQVPCHRVVGQAGALTGFAGGLDKKRALLKREGVRITGDRVDLSSCLWPCARLRVPTPPPSPDPIRTGDEQTAP